MRLLLLSQLIPPILREDVHVNNELLGILYQMAPVDANVLKQLEEDFKLAESSRTSFLRVASFTFNTRYKKPHCMRLLPYTIRKRRGALRPWDAWSSAFPQMNCMTKLACFVDCQSLPSLRKLPAAAKQPPINPKLTWRTRPVSDWNALHHPSGATRFVTSGTGLPFRGVRLERTSAHAYRRYLSQLTPFFDLGAWI